MSWLWYDMQPTFKINASISLVDPLKDLRKIIAYKPHPSQISG
ncbi:hypothetical protein Hanom_Chr05g00446631 [Helianthus anomalus]